MGSGRGIRLLESIVGPLLPGGTAARPGFGVRATMDPGGSIGGAECLPKPARDSRFTVAAVEG